MPVDLLEFQDDLVNPDCGIMTHLSSEPVPDGLDNLFIYRATLARPLTYDGPKCQEGYADPVLVSGVGADPKSALRSTLGEGVERYASMTFAREQTLSACYRDLPGRALHPGDLIGYTPEQYRARDFNFAPFDGRAPGHWAPAKDLTTGETIYVPANLVWLGVPLLAPDLRFAQPVSSGVAAGSDKAHATLAALLELVERDALISRWMLLASPPAIPDDALALPPDLEDMQQSANRMGAQITFHDLAIDGFCPVVCACFRWPELFPGLVLGAAAALSRPAAAAKALCEALHIFNSARSSGAFSGPAKNPPAAAAVKSFADHGRYYQTQTPPTASVFFSGEGQCSPCQTLPEESFDAGLSALIRRLSERGFPVLAVDITPPDIRAMGLSVVRCLVPGLQPISAGFGNECQDRRRLDAVAVTLGLERPLHLNLAPHPLS